MAKPLVATTSHIMGGYSYGGEKWFVWLVPYGVAYDGKNHHNGWFAGSFDSVQKIVNYLNKQRTTKNLPYPQTRYTLIISRPGVVRMFFGHPEHLFASMGVFWKIDLPAITAKKDMW